MAAKKTTTKKAAAKKAEPVDCVYCGREAVGRVASKQDAPVCDVHAARAQALERKVSKL